MQHAGETDDAQAPGRRRDGGDDADSRGPTGRRGSSRQAVPEDASDDADSDAIEILDVEATDEAGVPLPSEEIDVSVEEDDPAEGRSGPSQEALEHRVHDLERQAAHAETQAAEAREHLVRAAADLDNFRKRVERDRVEERKAANASLIKSLLPVTDNLGRAVEQAESAARDNPALASFAEGARLIATQLLDILRGAGLEAVDTSGAFDPNVHEALMQEPTDSRPHLAVTGVFETGWKLHGKLIRPARVKVAWNPEPAAAPEAAEQGED